MKRGTKFLRFGNVRQEVGAKHTQVGTLLEAVNVRQTAKAGVYAKRKGFARTAQTFSGGSLSGTPETILPGTGGNSLMRDTGDQLWARSAPTNTWTLMGTHRRPWPTVSTVQTNLYTIPQPFSVLVGSTLWAFALTTNAYEFSIIDAATGTVISSRISNTATGIVHGSAAYDGNYVWLFWVDNGANGTVYCHKLDPASPTTAPVATTYYQFQATPVDLRTVALQQVQAKYLSALGKVVVVACGGSLVSTTRKRAAMHSYLDPATGTAVSAGAIAANQNKIVRYSGTVGTHTVCGLCILDGQDGSASSWQYALYTSMDPAAGYGGANVFKFRVSNTNLADAGHTFKQVMALTDDVTSLTVAGYADMVNDKQYVLATKWTSGSASYGATNVAYTMFAQVAANDTSVTAPAGLDATDFAKCWTASGFAAIGSRVFIMLGYDDFTINQPFFGSESNSNQRSYQIRELIPGATGALTKLSVEAQFFVGNAAAIWHRNAGGTLAIPAGTPLVNCCPPMHAFGTKLLNACAVVSGALGYVDLAVVTTETAKVYGKSCQAMGRGFSPGGIPVTWNGQCPPHEIAPLIAPAYLTQTVAGTGTDFSIAAVVYAIYDNDGTAWRSSPAVLNATIGHGATLGFPSPPVWMSGTKIFAEIYIGNNATPKLQASFPIGTTYGPITWTTPTVANMVNGEVLYTVGGALSQAWPTPCQAIAFWNKRLFLAQQNTLWFSREIEAGFGPLLNEVLTATWSEETEDITAIAPVDWNYLAILSEGQTAVISGEGPDGIGNGNYVIKTLPSYTGVRAGGHAIQGAGGCYYQNKQTGRIMVVTPDLRVAECAGGAYDYAGYSMTAAAWYESENLLVFFAPASNAAVVIDYQHPQETAPFGQVYLWTFAAAMAPAACCRDASGLLVVNSSGHVYRPAAQWVDDNVGGTDSYRMKLSTAELQLADIQGSFNIERVQTLLTMRGASGISIGVYPGYASPTASDDRTTTVSIDLPAPTNDGDTESVLTRPANCYRIQSLRIVVQEKAGVTGQSFEFEGFAVEFTTLGNIWRPAEGRII